MTVAELIEKLKEMPGDAEAVAWSDTEDWAGLVPVDPRYVEEKKAQICQFTKAGTRVKYKEVSEYVDFL